MAVKQEVEEDTKLTYLGKSLSITGQSDESQYLQSKFKTLSTIFRERMLVVNCKKKEKLSIPTLQLSQNSPINQFLCATDTNNFG